MSVDEPLELESPASVKGPSELLVEARERLGLSQKEVADELYLTASFVEHIDAGEFASIPKPAFIKGYLRAYARVVELSGDDIVSLYDAELQIAEPTQEIDRVTEEDLGPASITGPVLQTGLMGLVGLALVVSVIWWIVSDAEEETPLDVAQTDGSQPAAQDSLEADFGFVPPSQEGATLQSEQVSQERLVADQAGLALKLQRAGALRAIEALEPALAKSVAEGREVQAILMVEELTQEPAIEQSISEQSISERSISGQDSPSVAEYSVKLERTAEGTRRLITVDAGGLDQLELLFSDECWVEIEDNQCGLIYNDLNRGSDVLTISGTGPFKVLLGKATGVEMIYNGNALDLAPFVGRDRTAKLTVPN